jgi:hypothetical protein
LLDVARRLAARKDLSERQAAFVDGMLFKLSRGWALSPKQRAWLLALDKR